MRSRNKGGGLSNERERQALVPTGVGMRVLLLAMPDVASCFDRVMRIPNLGIVSLAAALQDAEVRVLDLVTQSRRVGAAVQEVLASFQPDLVGLSAMTFQYDTAKQVAGLVTQSRPQTRTVLGGYHATLAYEQIAADPGAQVFDFLVRGEGELALNQLVQALHVGRGWAVRRVLCCLAGLSAVAARLVRRALLRPDLCARLADWGGVSGRAADCKQTRGGMPCPGGSVPPCALRLFCSGWRRFC